MCAYHLIAFDNAKTEAEKDEIQTKKEDRQKDAQPRYQLNKFEQILAKDSNFHQVLMVDLQKCPPLNNYQSFQQRKV